MNVYHSFLIHTLFFSWISYTDQAFQIMYQMSVIKISTHRLFQFIFQLQYMKNSFQTRDEKASFSFISTKTFSLY